MAMRSNDSNIVGLVVFVGGSVRLLMIVWDVKWLANGKTVDGGCGEEKCSSKET